MAEKTVRCLPDSPDVNRSWRRISTRKLSFLYTEETLLPNYLRSPTGSCHDACKYGRKHEPEEDKPIASPLKRVNRSFSGTLSFDSPLRKKALTKSVSSPFGSDGGCEHEVSQVGDFSSRVCDVKKKQNAERSRTKAVSLSGSRLANDSTKRKKTFSHSFKATVVSRRRALEIAEHDKRVTALKLKSVAQTAALALRRSTVNRKKVSEGSEASEPKKVAVPLRAKVTSKRCSRSLKTKKESHSLSSGHLKQTRKRVEDDKCKDLVEEKTLYVIKMNTGNDTVASDQNQRCVIDPPTDDLKREKCQDESESVVTEANDESPQEVEEEKVDEANDESPQDEDEEDEEEEASDESPQAIEKENTTRQGKSKSKPLSTESALNGKSMRLRFKRGKVLDVVGSQDNNSPRKLKFKRGKTVTKADTSSKDSSLRSLKTKGTNLSSDKEQQQHNPKPSEVVLKHQDTEEKKSDSSRALLFNNVIEETANKLVETRKSKVKALVGAFESVISLQERNSSPTTTT